MEHQEHIDLAILRRIPKLNTHIIMEIRPLAPLSMVSDMPGSFYKTLLYPSKKMICGLMENMLGWHFDRKLRVEIFDERKKCMKKHRMTVNLKDYQQGSTYIPLLIDYFELSGKPSLKEFKKVCNYADLWSRCYRRSDSSKHLNGCRNIEIDLIADKHTVFEETLKEKSSKERKRDAWFKEHIDKIPCFYTTPTSREYVDVDAVYSIALNVDSKLVKLLEHAYNGICYLGNSEGWVHVDIKTSQQ